MIKPVAQTLLSTKRTGRLPVWRRRDSNSALRRASNSDQIYFLLCLSTFSLYQFGYFLHIQGLMAPATLVMEL